MFTGIIEATSVVESLKKQDNLYSLAVVKPKSFNDIKIGDSIANDGVCLTVTAIKGGCLYFDLMKETLSATSLKHIAPGKKLNLERAMKADARMGGHFVSGHVDAVARIMKVVALTNYVEYRIELPKAVKKFVAPKGSVTIDGISLTVGEVRKDWFAVYFIPHTLAVTTIGSKKAGDEVNIEADLLARYVLNAKG
jgi:riboflavin synthase